MENNNRRNFLKQLSTLGLGASMVTPIAALADSKKVTASDTIDADANSYSQNPDKEVTISILQTTDVHCQIHPHDELFWENDKAVFRQTGGYAHLASFLKKEKRKNPNTFVIDTGDMFQGSELSVKTTGKAFLPILDAMNYDLYLPGNWEVIYGKKNMQTLLGALKAPKICANMYHDLGEGKRGELIFQPYYVWNVQGAKIGFVGYTDHLVPKRQSPIYSKGIKYSAPEENLAHYVDVLKNQEQCDYILLIAHLGLSQQINLANMPECQGVDYILGGDTHERVRVPIQCKYAKVVEPGAFGSFVGKLDLTIKNGKVIADKYDLVEITASKYKADKQLQAVIKNNEAPFISAINNVIGYSTVPLYRYFVVENTIDTLVLDAIYETMKNDVDIVLSNGFRFCPPRSTPDATGNIPITEGYVFDMLPVDSTIRMGKVTGQQITNWLEKELNNVFAANAAERFGGWVVKFKGMQVVFKAFAEKGKRVQSIKINGEALDKEKTYRVCACEREGDPEDMLCRMKNVQDTKNTKYTLHEALKSYIQKNSPVTPLPQNNATVIDASQKLLTQVRGVNYTFY